MTITFFSIMMALIWTTITAIILNLMRRSKEMVFPIAFLFTLCLLCIIRMCVPFEFPFTKVIKTPLLYNWMFPIFRRKILNHSITPEGILLIIWGVGSVILLIRMIVKYCIIYKELHNKIKSREDNILIDTAFSTPMQAGFFQSIILLPDMQYDTNTLKIIIKHENMHFTKHDTWIKLGMNIWKCIFWWFPLTYLIYEEVEENLELRCDRAVTKNMSNVQKKEYLYALLYVYEMNKNYSSTGKVDYLNATHFYKNKMSILCRFHYINSKNTVIKCTKSIYALLIILFLASYLLVFQSFAEPEYDDDGTYFNQEQAYIKYNMDGRYELYLDKKFQAYISEADAQIMIDAGVDYGKE